MKPHGTFIRGEVVALNDSSATLADGTQLAFDYAVIATGSSYAVGKSSSAFTLQQRVQELQVRLQADMAHAAILITCLCGYAIEG
jgi:hypothetical protein